MEWNSSDLFVEDDEEQDYNHAEGDGANKELVVYMIDAGPDMFVQLNEKENGQCETCFGIVIKCIVESLKSRIINRDYDEVGVCFYNTQKKKNMQESEGVYVFNVPDREELDRPTAKFIKELSEIEGVFKKEIGSQNRFIPGSRENPLYNALWVAQGLLRKGSTHSTDKVIMLFTNDDDPFGIVDAGVKADMRRTTIQRAKDIRDLGVNIELFPLSRPGEEFNVSIFFAEMLELENEEVTGFMKTVAERFEDLQSQLRKRIFKKRVVRKVTFMLDDNTSISLHTYALFRSALPGKHIWLDSTTNVPLKHESSYICTDTGALVTEPSQRFLVYNNQKVRFTNNELSELKKVTNVSLRLLGFKPLSCLKEYHNLQPSTFLYPSDEEINGSVCVFVALYKAMLRFEKYAVAFYASSLSPHLVALVAQEEVTSTSGQLEPPGMYMIYLPYCDDIRPVEKVRIDDEAILHSSEEQRGKAMDMIRKLDIKDFSVYSVSNPALQRHYAMLQVLALDEDDLPEIKDETMPDEEAMQRPGIAKAVEAFRDIVYGKVYDTELAETGRQKSKGSTLPQKRKEAADTAAKEVRKFDWNELANSGKLKELSAVDLKYYLTAHNLPVSGKKDVLINRILEHLGK
eukprot:TRINITY_DN25707_c0_g1_i1.p1 TRINITY_DN25707_c0_g1~~TRINITY_DN25707_c0_g1_i1.p1  ORF type:complete len:630 (-),score=139.97 TRINITY_DN25707_c0_g1_i1:36-1925(-)